MDWVESGAIVSNRHLDELAKELDNELEFCDAAEHGIAHGGIVYNPKWMCACGQEYQEHEEINGKRLCFPEDYPHEFSPIIDVPRRIM